MYKILITDGFDKNAIESLKYMDFEIVEQFYPKEELGEKLRDFDAVIIRSATKITKDVIEKACEEECNLKLIIRAGVGVDNIDVKAAKENKIEVKNTPNASSVSVAELAIGHIFALSRFINISNVTMREGKWEKKAYNGVEISGKTLGLVGFGRIAKEVAKRADALGMKVVYTDKLGKADGFEDYEYGELEDVLKKSDFVSLHIPYDKKLGAVITKKEIEKMKDGSYIINCARGGVVCEKDLLEALDSGKIKGAAVDVFAEEPTKNLDLVNHPKVSATPHIGASTKEAQEKIGYEVITVLKNYFNTEKAVALYGG